MFSSTPTPVLVLNTKQNKSTLPPVELWQLAETV